jgi:5-methylcytosine-specific restriction endonuclease McrA
MTSQVDHASRTENTMPTFPRGYINYQTNQGNARRHKQLITETPKVATATLNDALPRDRLILQLISRDGDRCYLCQNKQAPVEYEIDHIIPRRHGGPDNLWNLALACKSCNCRKNDRIVSIRITDQIPCYWFPR